MRRASLPPVMCGDVIVGIPDDDEGKRRHRGNRAYLIELLSLYLFGFSGASTLLRRVSSAEEKRNKKHRTAKTTVWDDFRGILEESSGTKLDDMTKLIRDAAKATTIKTLIEKEAPIPVTRLLILWRKRTNHLRRYCRTRKRRDIRKANSAMLGKNKGGSTAPNMALPLGKEITQILDEIGDVFFPQPATDPDPKIYEPEESKTEWYKADFAMWEMEATIERGNERSLVRLTGFPAPCSRTSRRPLNFIKAFLSGRKYLVKTGKHCSSEKNTNEVGVPQEAVLSPVLFNLAMAPLLWRLAVVPDLAFTVYTDDITE
ncbi:hypothetical protein HPB47_007356 [Ixodes persulcatus]|uniref:Uncharacterized protein n=1 Tax=Ixodes persulcatus TaxID=34615 RepID=A0AC60P7I8_IXOPE|nr:hypothetical protein HPB47_007356 [Ixodes persulcatus]